MSDIIRAQNGKNPGIKADDIQLGDVQEEILAPKSALITDIDMSYLNTIVRTLGAPADYTAGIYLHKKVGDKVEKGEVLYTLYSSSKHKLQRAKEMLANLDFYTYK